MMIKIAVITMVYNEQNNLPMWIKHYKKHLPNGELFIVDHGSTQRVSKDYVDVSTLRLPRSTFDDRKRAEFISNLHQSLLSDFDWVIYTDADELIVPEMYDTLEESLNNEPESSISINSVGLNIFQHLGCEESLDTTRPISEQRKYAVLEKAMCKPSVSRRPIKWTPGFHTSNNSPDFGNGYYLIHLKYIDIDWLRFRTEIASCITWSEEAIRKSWNRGQVINSEQLEKKFQSIANFINAGRITPFDFSQEKANFVMGATLDSNGNYRADGEVNSRVVEIPASLLVKLP